MKNIQHIIDVYYSDDAYSSFKYYATFDSYDGAPIDYETPSRDPIGYGDTEHEAMFDLLEKCL